MNFFLILKKPKRIFFGFFIFTSFILSTSNASDNIQIESYTQYHQFRSHLDTNPIQLIKNIDYISASTERQQLLHLLIKAEAYYLLVLPQDSMELINRGLAKVTLQENPYLFNRFSLIKSKVLDLMGKPKVAIKIANQVLDWAQNRHDKNLIIQSYAAVGLIQNSLVNYQEALKNLQTAYQLATNLDHKTHIHQAEIAGYIAIVYEYRNEDKLSLPFFEEAVAYHRKNNHLWHLGEELYGLGRANKNLGNFSQSRSQISESASIAEKIGDTQGVAYALKELAGLELKLNNLELAEQHTLKAKQLFENSANNFMLFDVNHTLARIYAISDRLEEATKSLDEAQRFVDPTTMPFHALSIKQLKADILAKRGNYRQAYELTLTVFKERQKLLRDQSYEQLNQLRAQFEIEDTKQRNKLLEKENEIQKFKLLSESRKNSQLIFIIGIVFLITLFISVIYYRQLVHKKRLQELADTDSLTGLLNRRKTLEQLDYQTNLAGRYNLQISIALIDLDHFKDFNDSFGHQCGDLVLKYFANFCRESLRSTDIIGRFGGEEFLVILPHTNQSDAQKIIDKLRYETKNLKSVFSEKEYSKDMRDISFSAGICSYSLNTTVEEMIHNADISLYRAKNNGRNRVEVFSS